VIIGNAQDVDDLEDFMRTRQRWDLAARLSLSSRGRDHAVVVGGSLAGMLAARVLSDHFGSVTLIERDRFTDTPKGRKGLPQGRHVHVLLERGRRALDRFLPGLTAELLQAGAEPLDATCDVAWMNSDGWYVRFPGKLLMLASTRDMIDWRVRCRVAELPNVRIEHAVDVTGLIGGPSPEARVTGVRLRYRDADVPVERDGTRLAADLVVVADGRNSRLPEWLSILGHELPKETVVNSFQGYASRLYRRPERSGFDWKALYIEQAPPAHPCGGLISPVEGGRWLVSLVGGDGHFPPTDEAGFLAFARNLRSPALYEAIVHAEPLTAIAGQRATENRLRHYDRLGRFPEGVVAIGDAVCAFNPIYGQGMTAAVLGAEVLESWLRGRPVRDRVGGRHFQRCLARATATAWNLAESADHRFRSTQGPPQGRVQRMISSYVGAVKRSATRRPWVRQRLTEVLHLLRPPSDLFGPQMVARLLWDRFVDRTRVGHRRFTGLAAWLNGDARLRRPRTAGLGVRNAATSSRS
jgi:2-polyprenyl-6-methoxyphenol hydroxylase-like FAD-dependent oxidoreductase